MTKISDLTAATTVLGTEEIPYRLGGTNGRLTVNQIAGLSAGHGSNTFTGTQTINPTAASLNQGLAVNQTGPASGSTVGPWSGNLIDATFSSTVTGSTNPFYDYGAWQTSATAFRVNFTVGGTNLSGEPFNAGMFQTRLTTAASPTGDGDFIGLVGQAYVNVVSTNSTLHGLAGGASVDSGASIRAMNGLFSEVDVIGTGVVGQRRGLSIASQAQGTATGSVDTGLYIASTYSSGAFKKWAVFDASAFQTTADIFWATGAQTVANIFNLPTMTVTGNILNFPNVTLSGAGVLVAGGGTADPNTGAMVNAAIPSGGKAALISQVNGTSAFSGLHVQNAAANSAFFAAVPDASSTATVFGQTAANWAEFVSAGASSNGILFGTLTSGPIVFGTNNTERARLTSGGFFNIGPSAAPDALLTVNANTGASVAPPSGTNLHVVGADSASNRIVMDAYTGPAVLNAQRAEGTQAAKTPAIASAPILAVAASGWNGTAQAASLQILFTARETFSGTASGGSIGIFTTPLTTTGVAESTRFQPSGGVSVGAAAIASDPGIGAINADRSIKSIGATYGIGYGAGAGGTVTQATSKATGVTLNTVSGAITMNNAALAAATIVSFVLTDSAIAATDVLILNHISGGTPGSYSLNARAAAGSATIDVRNNTAGSLSEAVVIQFALIKAVNS